MKNLSLFILLAYISIGYSQTNLPTFTPYEGHGIVPITWGDAWALDTTGDGIHDMVGTMGARYLPFIFEDLSLIDITTSIYHFDIATGSYIEDTSLPFKDLMLGVFVPENIDNQDGLDYLVSGSGNFDFNTDIHTIVYLDNGDGTYETQNLVPLVQSRAAFGNLFGNNQKDLVMTGKDENADERFIIYQNNNGVLTKVLDIVNDSRAVKDGSLLISDIDSDGDEDIVYTGTTGNSSRGFTAINNGDGTFTFRENITAVHESTTSIGDINGDGISDLFISGNANVNFAAEVCIGNGDGTYRVVHEGSIVPHYFSSSLLYDFNGDNKLDLYLSGVQTRNGGLGVSDIYINDGTGLFTKDTSLNFKGMAYSSSLILNVKIDGKLQKALFTTGNIALYPANNVRAEFLLFEDSSLSVADDSLNDSLRVYPNPVSDNLQVKNIDNINIKNIEIYTLQGQKKSSYVSEEEIDISNLSNGMYLLKVTASDDKTQTIKFIKE